MLFAELFRERNSFMTFLPFPLQILVEDEIVPASIRLSPLSKIIFCQVLPCGEDVEKSPATQRIKKRSGFVKCLTNAKKEHTIKLKCII